MYTVCNGPLLGGALNENEPTPLLRAGAGRDCVRSRALPASAATAFPDIQSHWAKSYIEEMTDANMFKGYEDGTFKPENKLTTAEALALCARAVGLDENTSAEIADDYKEAVDDVLDGSQSWFYREFAICLAAGILTESNLKSLTQSGALIKPIVKEDLAVYLIRAMQLGPCPSGSPPTP